MSSAPPTNVYYPNPTGGENNQHPLNFSADNLNGELGGGVGIGGQMTAVSIVETSSIALKENIEPISIK